MAASIISRARSSRPREARRSGPQNARSIRALFLSDASNERNGVGSYYADLVYQLRERGARVELIAPDPEHHPWRPYVPLPGDSTQRVFLPPIATIRRLAQELEPEVIVVPTPGPYGWVGCALARVLGIRLVGCFHTHYERLAEVQRNPLVRGVGRLGFSLAHYGMFRTCDKVLTVSSRLSDVATRIGATHVELVGTPIARRFLRRPTRRARPVLERVLFVGRLSPEKNIGWILDAAREIPEIEFEIIGDGPLRAEVLRAAEDTANLATTGWVPRQRIPERMDAADLVLLPSREESFGTVALEAMARERPVLTSAACGIRDWPGFDEASYVLGPGERLSDAVRRIAERSGRDRAERARRARALALELNEQSLRDWIGQLADAQEDRQNAPSTSRVRTGEVDRVSAG